MIGPEWSWLNRCGNSGHAHIKTKGPEIVRTWLVVPEVQPNKQTLYPGAWMFTVALPCVLRIVSILGILILEPTMLERS